MKTIEEPKKNIKVFYEADVVVVGGGPAGIGAALAAGRSGAKTVLIERYGCLGGMQTQCFQVHFAFNDPKIHGGVVSEILKRLEDAGATPKVADLAPPTENDRFQKIMAAVRGKDNIPKRMFEKAGYWWQWYREIDGEYYKFLLDRMMEDAGVKLVYHSFAAGALTEDNRLKGVIIENKEGRQIIFGKVIIDTTGDGDIAWKSGAKVRGGEGVPVGPNKGNHSGMISSFYIGGVDQAKFDAYKRENPEEWGGVFNARKMIQAAMKEGYHLRNQGVGLRPKPGNRKWPQFTANSVQNERCWSTEELTAAEIELRQQMFGLARFLKDKIPGFENAFVDKTPVAPLSGDQHRIIGNYTLTIGDMRQGRQFEDGIGINNMVPDLFTITGTLSYDTLPHDMPYRSLVSASIENLMAAGTTASTGILAMTGLRYCTPSLIQGQAAGTAAAMAAKADILPKDIDTKKLQENLRGQGAIVTVGDLGEDVLEPYKAIQELSKMAPKPDIYDEVAKY